MADICRVTLAKPDLESTSADKENTERRKVRLGDVLVQFGLVEPDDLAKALEVQASTNERLGQILLSQEKIGAHGLAMALAAMFGLEMIDLSGLQPDAEAVKLIPEAVARRVHALPVGWHEGDLIIAVDDPSNLFALDDIRTIAGVKTRFVLARADQLAQALDRAWHAVQAASHDEDTMSDPDAVSDQSDDTPIIRFTADLIRRAWNDGASDIHLEATADGGRVRFRVDGQLHDAMMIGPDMFSLVKTRIKLIGGLDISLHRVPQDGRLSVPFGDFELDIRIATLPTIHGESVILRLLDKRGGIVGISELGFLPDTRARFEAAYHKPWGTVMVTGPTGSGKTTTIYATVVQINNPEKNIVSVENPVEFHLPGIKQVQVSEKIGLTFDRCLRGILRSDPDVLVIGEIRDRETARIAAEAALTGHLVLTTLHTKDASSTPVRLIEMGLEPYLVSTSIDCVVAQRLARSLCALCADEFVPTEFELAAVGWYEAGMESPGVLKRARGCPDCNETGYRGRFAIHELMELTPDIRRLILGNATSEQIRGVAIEAGMRPLYRDGLFKVASGRTSLEELARVVASEQIGAQGAAPAPVPAVPAKRSTASSRKIRS